MKQPGGFESPTHPSHVLRLHKALYGLKQSPRAWFSKLSACLLEWGFVASKADSSMFVFKSSLHIIIFLIYVDDILVTGSSLSLIQHFISALNLRFSLKDMGKLSYFLGIHVTRNSNGLHLSQHKYILDILSRANLSSSKPLPSPMVVGTPLSLSDGSLLENASEYRSLVGALQYCTLTRPE